MTITVLYSIICILQLSQGYDQQKQSEDLFQIKWDGRDMTSATCDVGLNTGPRFILFLSLLIFSFKIKNFSSSKDIKKIFSPLGNHIWQTTCIQVIWRTLKTQQWDDRDYLVIQWLRICLPIQGTWVQSLVGELGSHMLRGN